MSLFGLHFVPTKQVVQMVLTQLGGTTCLPPHVEKHGFLLNFKNDQLGIKNIGYLTMKNTLFSHMVEG